MSHALKAYKFSFLVHSVRRHIVIEHLAVVLLLTLNVREGRADGSVTELKDTSVIKRGDMLFAGQGVGA